MDNLKEKLISMIQEAVGGCARHWASLIADYLIANGVTVQEGKDNDVPTKWIPVAERLPETCGYPVLMVAANKYGQKKIVKGFTNYECPVEFCTNEKEYDLCWHCWEVTHWMPLPEPPKKGE